VNQNVHTDAPTIWAGIISIANLCLMVLAAFYPKHALSEGLDANWRAKTGIAAVCLGLCSQVLYCLMLFALIHGWVPFTREIRSIIFS
jgi:cytochrome c biogenesis protein CcdA